MENEQPEFVDADAAPDPPRPINHNDRATFNQNVQPTRRTIGDFGAPTTLFANRSAIRPPPVNRNNYEIKSSIINLVKQYQFHGLPNEHPMDHIESFEEICSTTRSNGVPANFLKCKLFAFSLADKAHCWLKSLPPDTFITWDECKTTFLRYFYVDPREEELEERILMSTKRGREPYSDTHNHYRPGLFKETMSLIPRGTTFQDAWERYSLREAFEGSSLTEEQAEGIYEISKTSDQTTVHPSGRKQLSAACTTKLDREEERSSCAN